MTEKFHTEMTVLKKEVLDMGSLVEEMLSKSIEALEHQDTTVSEWVISNKGKIAEYDATIEQKCLTLIALYQPMAKDMRTIATCLKLNTYLYRIGRYGKDIAMLVPELSGSPPLANLMGIPPMADLVLGMIRDSLSAFDREEISLVQDIATRDNTVDALRYSIFQECITSMREDSRTIARCTNYIMIARYLERCGDHACKIAEKIHYMVTGERVEWK
jgi:phosphate transport system protein